MSIWLALIVPLIGAFVMLKWYRKKMTWWEIIIPLIACIIFIGTFKFIVQKIETTDTEYHGSLIVKARYYEYWATWVHKTCSYTTCSGSGKSQTCTTHYYDCSYCDTHAPYWEVTNSLGQTWVVTESFYNYLIRKWHASPQFVNMHRDIDYEGGCGKDGNAYEIHWDNKPLSSEATTTEHSYENRIKVAHTAFDFPDITAQDVKQYSLYNYPKVTGFQQETILGLDSIRWLTSQEKAKFHQWGMFLDGYLGPKKHARIYYLLFRDQPHLAGKMQEARWFGGNDNELVICIGLSSKSRKIQWVYPFSWTPKRETLVDVREDLMKDTTFNVDSIATATWKDVEKDFKRRDFKEFSYVTVEPPLWGKWVTWIITIILTFGLCYWAVTNEYDADPNNAFKTVEENDWKRRDYY